MKVAGLVGRLLPAVHGWRGGARLPWWLLPAFVALYAVAGVYTELRFMERKPLPGTLLEDFSIYARAFADAAAGGDPYNVRKVGLGFLYPPQSLLVIAPFALIADDALRALAYSVFNLLLLGVMLAGIARLYGLTLRQSWWWYPVAFTFAPFLELLHIGQINLITSFGVFVALAFARRAPPLAGVGWALAIGTKVTPAALVVYFLVRRCWRVIAWGVVGVLGSAAAAALLFGADHFVGYADVFRVMTSTFLPGDWNRQALVSQLNYHGWLPTWRQERAQMLLNGYLLAMIGLSALLAHLSRQEEPLFLVIGFLTVVTPNVMWYHHYVFALLPLFVWIAWSRAHPAVVAWCLAGMLGIQVDRFLLTSGLIGHAFLQASVLGIVWWQVRVARATLRRESIVAASPLRLAAEAALGIRRAT